MVDNQVFNQHIDCEILYKLLRIISHVDKNGRYIINRDIYKKMLFHELHFEFIAEMTAYYRPSKLFYINRPLTYNSFTTIVRHICRYGNINFVSKAQYRNTRYYTEYIIYPDKLITIIE